MPTFFRRKTTIMTLQVLGKRAKKAAIVTSFALYRCLYQPSSSLRRSSKNCRPAMLVTTQLTHVRGHGVLLTLLAALWSITFADGASAKSTGLQPHRSIYNVSLAEHSDRTEIVGAEGKMFYRISASCDGWSVENRTVLRLAQESGSRSDSVWTFASWEARNGTDFQFAARYEQDGELVERLVGHAKLEGDRRSGQATLSRPTDEVIQLPPGTLFPTEHVRVLIQSAHEGQKLVARPVFDGASLDNPYLVNAIIAPLEKKAATALQKKTNLGESPAWHMQLAFFSMREEDNALPEFEISVQYREDGVADHIIQTFKTFALKVELEEFQSLPQPDC